VADKAIEKLKATIRELTRRSRSLLLVDIVQELKTALTGWKAYLGIAEVLSLLREIDKWMRRPATMLRMETMGQRRPPRVT
jgi:RNA-directed DNA polymerase